MDRIETLKLKTDESVNIYPNVKNENIPLLTLDKIPTLSEDKIPQLTNEKLPDTIDEERLPDNISPDKISTGLIYTHIINFMLPQGEIYLMFNDSLSTEYVTYDTLYNKFGNIDAFIPVSGYNENTCIIGLKFDSDIITIKYNTGNTESIQYSSFYDTILTAR